MKQRIFISSVQSEFTKERAGLKKYIETHPTLSRFFSVFVFEKKIFPQRTKRRMRSISAR